MSSLGFELTPFIVVDGQQLISQNRLPIQPWDSLFLFFGLILPVQRETAVTAHQYRGMLGPSGRLLESEDLDIKAFAI
jgi:hypothetical protein